MGSLRSALPFPWHREVLGLVSRKKLSGVLGSRQAFFLSTESRLFSLLDCVSGLWVAPLLNAPPVRGNMMPCHLIEGCPMLAPDSAQPMLTRSTQEPPAPHNPQYWVWSLSSLTLRREQKRKETFSKPQEAKCSLVSDNLVRGSWGRGLFPVPPLFLFLPLSLCFSSFFQVPSPGGLTSPLLPFA